MRDRGILISARLFAVAVRQGIEHLGRTNSHWSYTTKFFRLGEASHDSPSKEARSSRSKESRMSWRGKQAATKHPALLQLRRHGFTWIHVCVAPVRPWPSHLFAK